MAPANGDAAGPSSSQDGSAATMKKRNKPQYHPFTQQQLPACKPILAPQTVIPVLLFVGIVFIPIGLGCIAASNRVVEVVYQYETSCVPGYMIDNKIAYIQNPSIDTRILKVPKDMKQPIYIYYQLDKFYQNHRRYVTSRSDKQLRSPNEVSNTKSCKPEATEHGSPIVPCGLVAWSLFNDTYSFARGNEVLMVQKRGISWRSEREGIFGKQVYPRNFQNGTLIGGGTLDPRIPAGGPDRLDANRGAANVPEAVREDRGGPPRHELITVTLQNNYNTYSFGGKKALVLSTAGVLGGKSDFLGRGYVVVGLAFPLREEHLALRYPLSGGPA
ncbi:ALA-interacting subunit 5-like [Panicum miliaceum]|uniref:ALA-interacting subunit n=1 Tax=Panicum miliaceum TaxID=4540 RepID=A0A3L6TB38_PANMI|nr:ALA-interacting subunit 5-like [Panicum miliaceum]